MYTQVCNGKTTHQYGVPMNVPRLLRVFLFLAETPKSADGTDSNKLLDNPY